MTSPFPQESIEIYSRLVAADKLHNPKRKPYQMALLVMHWAENVPYGFEDNLLTGNYAPWPHELHSGKITGYNCTTIIPEIYLILEEYGLKPEIVQFVHCKNKKKDEKEYFFESHFAVIVDIGKTQPYLIDPFQEIMGPIKHRDKHTMAIGSYNDYPSARREYKQLLTYSPEEFVALMERLRQPADSLDMLVAGQKLYKNRLVNSVKCDLMIYYDNHKNLITTRLDIPQVARQSKVIHYILPASERGEFEEGSLEFSYANKFGWKDLQGEVKLARLNYSEIRQLGRYCSKMAKDCSRLGLELVSEFKLQLESKLLLSSISQVNIPTDKQVKDNLCSLADTLWGRLSLKEQTSLEQKIIARTLYEGTHLERDYHFPEEEGKKKLMVLLEKNREIHSLIEPLKDLLHDHNWKLDRLSLKESR
ncbi:hypothetical protein HYU21_04765, partial [Candidatus Woesearchaeota archaeon]|nr:hypothetical protein [Candidatus Woesearchaeota archaeon]